MMRFTELEKLKEFLEKSNVSEEDKKKVITYFENHIEEIDERFTISCYDEVLELLKEQICDDMLRYFNPDFVSEYTDLSSYIIRIIQNSDEKDVVEQLVKLVGDNMDSLVRDALSLDSVGHFFNWYDGSYEEFLINNEIYYIWFN